LASTTALSGLKQLSLFIWFRFNSSAANHQWLSFRTDNQHSLDIFSQTSSSVTWGSDWAGAWNGSSTQALSGLVDGDFVCLGASITQSGARLFHQGSFARTKTGSAFTTSSSTVAICQAGEHGRMGGAAFAVALPDEAMAAYTSNPWQLYGPRRIWVPVSAGGGAYTLTAEQGSYTLTGQAAALLAGRALAAAQGSYTLTGQDAALLKGNTLAADQGSYSLTGQDAALLRGLLLSAAQGSYALTGQDATLTYTPLGAFSLTADQGSYALTGQSVSLLWGHVLAAGQGSYTLNGQDATLTYTPVGAYILTAGQGSYALTGQDVLLQWGHVLAAAQGSYTLTGQAATLARGIVLTAAQGSYTLTGQAAAFARTYVLSAGYGSYALTGQIVSLSYSGAALEALEYLLLISHITQSMSKTSKVTMEVDLISRIQQQLDGSSSI
jgi:hypothetical protein